MADFLKTGELARRLGVCPGSVRKWVRLGVIPALRVGRTIRFDFDAVVKALSDSGVPATNFKG